jgi:biotin transporter BioY
MVGTLIAGYLIGWLLASFAAYAAGKRLADRRTSPNQPMMVMVSVAAGAVWPLLVVGLVELSSVMVLTKVPAKPKRNIGIYA